LHEPFSPALQKKEEPIFLDKNENPFRLPPSLREEIRQIVSSIDLNRYPDPEAKGLKQALSEMTGIPAKSIVVGNGGDEILTMLFEAFVEAGAKVVSLSPTFSQYPELCRRHKAEWVKVPLNIGPDEIALDEELFLNTVEKCSPALVLVDSPNNPTGLSLKESFVDRLLEVAPGVVVVDEAYGEFADRTFLEGLRNRPPQGKVCVLKTLSKAWGMAGLRLGYAACSSEVAEKLESVRDLYNVGLFAQEVAPVVLQYREWMDSRVLSIRYMRNQLIRTINRIKGYHAFPSESNFVLVRADIPAEILRGNMEEENIFVKFVQVDAPGNWLRVSIGKEDELGRLVNALQNCV
jgi:histidinol-phosphate aminotransferase